MAQIHKVQVETEIKTPAAKFYERFKNGLSDLTKVFPEMYETIEILAGDEKSEGSIICYKYSTVVRHKFLRMNDKDRFIVYDIFEGDLRDTYNTFVLKLQVIQKEDKSLVKWFAEYEKPNEDVVHPNIFMGSLGITSKAFDAYLINKD